MTNSYALLVAVMAASVSRPSVAQPSCSNHPAPTENIAAQLAKLRPVQMPFSTTGLSAREVQMLRKVVEARQYLESAFWRESDRAGLRGYQALLNCPATIEEQGPHY